MLSTVRVVALKLLAFASQGTNVLVAAAVLPSATAAAYLVMMSAVQLAVPFAGLGLSQRLVTEYVPGETRVRIWPYVASWLCIAAFVCVVVMHTAGPATISIVAVGCVLAALITLAEHQRCATGSQGDFVVFNFATFALAGLVAACGYVGLWMVAVPTLGLVVSCGRTLMRNVAGSNADILRPRWRDLLKSLRVLFTNQYYNVLIVLLPLALDSASVVRLALVYKLNILFNWQTFYWLRVAHKRTLPVLTSGHRIENSRMLRLNHLSVGAYCASALALAQSDLMSSFPSLDESVLWLGVGYAALMTAENAVFPYEVFSVYVASRSVDLRLVLSLIGGLLVVFAVASVTREVVAVLLAAEVTWFVWRLYSRHAFLAADPAHARG